MENIFKEIEILVEKTGVIFFLAILGVTSRILIKSRDKKLTKMEIFTSYVVGVSFAMIFGYIITQYYSNVPYVGYAGAYVIGKIGEDLSTYLIKQFSQENIKKTINLILIFFKK